MDTGSLTSSDWDDFERIARASIAAYTRRLLAKGGVVLFDVDDVAQESLVKVFELAQQSADDDPALSRKWRGRTVASITRFTIKNMGQHERRGIRRSRYAPSLERLRAEPAGKRDCPYRRAVLQEDRHRVVQVFSRLSREDVKLLVAVHVRGVTVAELSKVWGVPPHRLYRKRDDGEESFRQVYVEIAPSEGKRLRRANRPRSKKRRTKNEERRTKNEERRTKNEERRTKNLRADPDADVDPGA